MPPKPPSALPQHSPSSARSLRHASLPRMRPTQSRLLGRALRPASTGVPPAQRVPLRDLPEVCDLGGDTPHPCTPPCPSDNAKHHCACIQGLCPRNPVGAPSALSLVGSIASARIASAYAAYAISAPRSGTSSGLHGRSARSEGTPPRPPRGLRPRRGHPAPQPSLREPSAPSLTALRCEPAQAVSYSCESDTACATMDLVINATIATQ